MKSLSAEEAGKAYAAMRADRNRWRREFLMERAKVQRLEHEVAWLKKENRYLVTGEDEDRPDVEPS